VITFELLPSNIYQNYNEGNSHVVIQSLSTGLYFLVAFVKFWKATISFVTSICLSVRMEHLCSHWMGFHELWYYMIFKKSVKKFRCHWSLGRILDILCEDICKFVIISCWILRMRSVSDKNCRENKNIHFVFHTSFAAYEVMWKHIVEQDRPQVTI
jgi:hypothetical protein